MFPTLCLELSGPTDKGQEKMLHLAEHCLILVKQGQQSRKLMTLSAPRPCGFVGWEGVGKREGNKVKERDAEGPNLLNSHSPISSLTVRKQS